MAIQRREERQLIQHLCSTVSHKSVFIASNEQNQHKLEENSYRKRTVQNYVRPIYEVRVTLIIQKLLILASPHKYL